MFVFVVVLVFVLLSLSLSLSLILLSHTEQVHCVKPSEIQILSSRAATRASKDHGDVSFNIEIKIRSATGGDLGRARGTVWEPRGLPPASPSPAATGGNKTKTLRSLTRLRGWSQRYRGVMRHQATQHHGAPFYRTALQSYLAVRRVKRHAIPCQTRPKQSRRGQARRDETTMCDWWHRGTRRVRGTVCDARQGRYLQNLKENTSSKKNMQ